MNNINNYILEKLKINKNSKIESSKLDYVFAYPNTQDAIDEICTGNLSRRAAVRKAILYIDSHNNDFGFILSKKTIEKLENVKDIDWYEIPDKYKTLDDFKIDYEDKKDKYKELEKYNF